MIAAPWRRDSADSAGDAVGSAVGEAEGQTLKIGHGGQRGLVEQAYGLVGSGDAAPVEGGGLDRIAPIGLTAADLDGGGLDAMEQDPGAGGVAQIEVVEADLDAERRASFGGVLGADDAPNRQPAGRGGDAQEHQEGGVWPEHGMVPLRMIPGGVLV